VKISIIGYDLRALSLTRLFLKEGHDISIVSGFQHTTFENIVNYPIFMPNIPQYEQVKNIKKIVDIIENIKPELIICLHIESCEIGLVEVLRLRGFNTFGINAECALLETSKNFGISFAEKSGFKIPNTTFVPFEKKEEYYYINLKDKIVIKEDGLSGGKGTYIVENKHDFINTIKNIKTDFLIQEYVKGEEIAVSLLFSNGKIHLLNINFEIKRKYNGDIGENTSGMGTIARNVIDLNQQDIIKKVLKNLPENLLNIKYYGAIDLNFIINDKKEFVFLEFTCRFGDPELCSELLLINDIGKAFVDLANNNPLEISYKSSKWAVSIVARDIEKIIPISNVSANNYIVDMLNFGNYDECCVSAYGDNYFELTENIYTIFNKILPKKSHYRTDIHESIENRWQSFEEACK